MFDAHCHLDDARLEGDREAVIARAAAAGVRGLAIAGVEPGQWARAAAVREAAAATQPSLEIYLGVGHHPWKLAPIDARARATAVESLCNAARALDARFIGEFGLDALRGDRDAQEAWLSIHLEAARALDLPIVLHIVRAHDEALALLARARADELGGFVHGFSGSGEHLRRYTDLGLGISLGGPVTWAGSRRAAEAAARTPREWLLVETDAPDQPAGRRARGEPADLAEIIGKIAALRDETAESVAAATAANARRILRLPPPPQMF